jgi:hypothetical protein
MAADVRDIFAYVDARREPYLAHLIAYVSRPSISAHDVMRWPPNRTRSPIWSTS